MDLRQLRCFAAVAEARSLAGAARGLAVSQPALTKTIQALEADLGFKLFERRSRGVILTALGEALYTRSQLILAEVARTRSELSALRRTQGGEIHIGALRAAANTRLPDAVMRFSNQRPDLRLKVEVDQNTSLISNLARGRFDFVVGVGESDLGALKLDYEPLWTDALVVVTRAGHPLHQGRGEVGITPAELARQTWIMPDSGTPYRRRLDDYFYSVGVQPPTPALICGQLQFIRTMLLKGDYLAFLPSDSIGLECEAGLLVAHAIESDFLTRSIGLVTRRDHVLTSGSVEFLALLRELIRASAPSRGHSTTLIWQG